MATTWHVMHPQWIRFKTTRASKRLPDLLYQQRKRLAGPPRSGRVSVVVTDIQEFSRLTAEVPQEMAQVRARQGGPRGVSDFGRRNTRSALHAALCT